jgi:hypothetical protein
MKRLLFIVVSLIAFSISAGVAGDVKYFSRVIHETDSVWRIELSSGLYMKIMNFNQSGGGNEIGSVAVFQGAEGLPGVSVATPNVSNPVYVAGPAAVSVAPVPGATLFISYMLGRNPPQQPN